MDIDWYQVSQSWRDEKLSASARDQREHFPHKPGEIEERGDKDPTNWENLKWSSGFRVE